MEEQNKIIENEIELSEEVTEVIQALNPKIELHALGENKHKITYDGEALDKVITKIKNQKQEIVLLRSGLLDIEVQIHSRTESLSEVQKQAHKSMEFLTKSIPCHIPLGVG